MLNEKHKVDHWKLVVLDVKDGVDRIFAGESCGTSMYGSRAGFA